MGYTFFSTVVVLVYPVLLTNGCGLFCLFLSERLLWFLCCGPATGCCGLWSRCHEFFSCGPTYPNEGVVWRIAILESHFFFFFFLTESCLFVACSFHSPQVLLEFCGFMQLSALSFNSEFSCVL